MTTKPYYNHDRTWLERNAHNSPVWGHYSAVLYTHVLEVLAQVLRPPSATATGSPAGERPLLDGGCGAGQFGTFATQAGFRYTGIDESPAAIALGHKHWPTLDLRCLDLAQPVEARDLTGSFTVVTSLNVFHCLVEKPHRDQYLRNLRGFLSADGILLMTTMCGPLLKPHRPSREPRIYLTPEEIRQELADAGFAQTVWSNNLPADDTNPVPNLEVVVC